jgi:hypothetical protein
VVWKCNIRTRAELKGNSLPLPQNTTGGSKKNVRSQVYNRVKSRNQYCSAMREHMNEWIGYSQPPQKKICKIEPPTASQRWPARLMRQWSIEQNPPLISSHLTPFQYGATLFPPRSELHPLQHPASLDSPTKEQILEGNLRARRREDMDKHVTLEERAGERTVSLSALFCSKPEAIHSFVIHSL